MSLTIQLPANIEKGLREDAKRQGLSLEKYVSLLLITGAAEKQPRLTTEEELMQKINLHGVSQLELEKFAALDQKRKEEKLSPADHQELITLINKIEIAHAERMKYVIALAQLRGISVQQLMTDLRIKTGENE